jgi:hypothetical protein
MSRKNKCKKNTSQRVRGLEAKALPPDSGKRPCSARWKEVGLVLCLMGKDSVFLFQNVLEGNETKGHKEKT